ncbi:GNAT family N-acetyltransferase [Rhodococcus sp. 105337]|uniref:GNAT family N-acetyltransferase n=1 Tax=Rhodococcus sp. 105337 TaxID=2725310 RepID=UPI001469A39F|nr:GNAT family N-acetyltransferase [Rhodococcus sp. 105337]
MTLHIHRADFSDPRLAAFLQAHLDELAPTAPPESRHALDLSGLRQPGVRLWVGEWGEAIAATGALAALGHEHEELKSMRTDPRRRGHGVGREILRHLLADAVSRGVRQISLETGSTEFFAPARALYAGAGFVVCGPFGDYRDDPHSVYMTLTLPLRPVAPSTRPLLAKRAPNPEGCGARSHPS